MSTSRLQRIACLNCLFVMLAAASSLSITARGADSAVAPKKLAVRLKVVELEIGKLKALGFDWQRLGDENGAATQEPLSLLVSARDERQLSGFLQALTQNSLARVIAEPTICTLDGRPATLAVGLTRLDVVPVVLGSGKIRLECRLEVAADQMSAGLPAIPAGRSAEPAIHLDAASELDPGTWVVLGHRNSSPRGGTKKNEAVSVVLAQVDFMDAGSVPTTSHRADTDGLKPR
jgi:hypothetical protein